MALGASTSYWPSHPGPGVSKTPARRSRHHRNAMIFPQEDEKFARLHGFLDSGIHILQMRKQHWCHEPQPSQPHIVHRFHPKTSDWLWVHISVLDNFYGLILSWHTHTIFIDHNLPHISGFLVCIKTKVRSQNWSAGQLLISAFCHLWQGLCSLGAATIWHNQLNLTYQGSYMVHQGYNLLNLLFFCPKQLAFFAFPKLGQGRHNLTTSSRTGPNTVLHFAELQWLQWAYNDPQRRHQQMPKFQASSGFTEQRIWVLEALQRKFRRCQLGAVNTPLIQRHSKQPKSTMDIVNASGCAEMCIRPPYKRSTSDGQSGHLWRPPDAPRLPLSPGSQGSLVCLWQRLHRRAADMLILRLWGQDWDLNRICQNRNHVGFSRIHQSQPRFVVPLHPERSNPEIRILVGQHVDQNWDGTIVPGIGLGTKSWRKKKGPLARHNDHTSWPKG